MRPELTGPGVGVGSGDTAGDGVAVAVGVGVRLDGQEEDRDIGSGDRALVLDARDGDRDMGSDGRVGDRDVGWGDREDPGRDRGAVGSNGGGGRRTDGSVNTVGDPTDRGRGVLKTE